MRLNSYIIRLYKKASTNPRKYIFIPLTVYWIILFILTTYPSRSLPTLATSDKLKHFVAYMILTLLLRLAFHFHTTMKQRFRTELPVVIGIIVFYGLFDEIHQYFIPGRYFELLDLAANYIGLLVGIVLASYFIKIGSRRLNSG